MSDPYGQIGGPHGQPGDPSGQPGALHGPPGGPQGQPPVPPGWSGAGPGAGGQDRVYGIVATACGSLGLLCCGCFFTRSFYGLMIGLTFGITAVVTGHLGQKKSAAAGDRSGTLLARIGLGLGITVVLLLGLALVMAGIRIYHGAWPLWSDAY